MMTFLFISLFACIVLGEIHNLAFVVLVVLFTYKATKQLYKFTKGE